MVLLCAWCVVHLRAWYILLLEIQGYACLHSADQQIVPPCRLVGYIQPNQNKELVELLIARKASIVGKYAAGVCFGGDLCQSTVLCILEHVCWRI